MKRRLRNTATLLLTVLSLAEACTDSFPGNETARIPFSAIPVTQWTVDTRSLLSSDDIETRITSVTLAAYDGGLLATCGHFTSGSGAMVLTLERSRTYRIYALVNMGDMRSALPSSESALDALTYVIPSYTGGSSSVNERGIPMAGSLDYSPRLGGSTAISVERLLARVTATLNCHWDGAISSVKVRNMNAVMKPFAQSAAAASSDILSEAELCEGNGATSGTFVFYVPENLQGTIGGITTAAEKSPDWNTTVAGRLPVLTFLVTTVEASGSKAGTVVYSSLLGANATTDFNIRRNCRYLWTIDFLEDGLQKDNWKIDTSGLQDYTVRQRLGISPVSSTLAVGEKLTYTARLYEDLYLGDTLVETDAVGSVIANSQLNWRSSRTSRATITSSGTATGQSPGGVTITATLKTDTSVQATASLTVYSTGASIDTGWDDGGTTILD